MNMHPLFVGSMGIVATKTAVMPLRSEEKGSRRLAVIQKAKSWDEEEVGSKEKKVVTDR